MDFFTPIVDDPYDFGRIAAANALSDVYAMGGRPVCALAVAAFPDDLDPSVVATILRGGVDVAAEAGISIIGGHTIKDPEPKYGLAVTGIARTNRILRNNTGLAGDVLILQETPGQAITRYVTELIDRFSLYLNVSSSSGATASGTAFVPVSGTP